MCNHHNIAFSIPLQERRKKRIIKKFGLGENVKPEDVKIWYKPDQWNEMTVEAREGNIIVKVNGMESARLTNDTGSVEGKIALQLHGEMDMEVMFKEVKIKVL